jgi:hypothetical protein
MSHDTIATADRAPRSGVERPGRFFANMARAAALLATAGVCGWLPLQVQAQCVLGGQPPCEASAALIVDCPDGVGRCLLVGDNEVRRDLFLYRLDGNGRPVGHGQVMTLDLSDNDELSDIEALTRSANGKLLVFGSHGRKSDCDAAKKRRRLGIVQALDPQPIAVEVRQSDKIECSNLFVDDIRDQPLIQAVCGAIERTEADAEAVAKDLKDKRIDEDEARRRCNAITPYNAEGAVDIATIGSKPDLWIGLRSPLLPSHPAEPRRRDLALLLHLRDLDAYRFDRVAVADLDGRGIRDLAVADGWIWLIAGPAQDLSAGDAQPFQLRRFRADELSRDAIVRPELVRDDLPTSSEGLALLDDQAIVVIDGDQGKDCGGSCAIASRYLVLSLPLPAAASGAGRP